MIRATRWTSNALLLSLAWAGPAEAAPPAPAGLFAYDASADLQLRTRGVEERGGVKVADVVFDGGGSDVSAYLVTPPGDGPFAGVLWAHWLGEPATTNRTQFLAEAVALAPRGFVSLLVDAMWSKPKWYESRVPEEDFENSRRQVIALRRAMDVLEARPQVDRARLGVVGHDYGGMYAMLMAGADPRAKTYVYVATAPSLSHWAFFANQPKSKVDYLRQNAVLELTDALRQVGNASTLFQFGTRDAYVSRADTAVLFAAAQGKKERKFYDAEHEMALPQAAVDRDAWLVQELALPAAARAR